MKLALLGCGALAELYYVPLLRQLESRGRVQLIVLFDPNRDRMESVAKKFPNARTCNSIEALAAASPALAIVTSPPKLHAVQTITLLEAGINVLCEKPMAATVAEAQAMVDVTTRTKRLLAIGLFRRFFPVNQMIKAMVSDGSLGRVSTVEVAEGGAFDWPAQSASFFDKRSSQGGVLADLGVHVVDLLVWWFGAPESVRYEDDAMGGLEANCTVQLAFADNIDITVRLSRDTEMGNRWILRTDRGVFAFPATGASVLEWQPLGQQSVWNAHVCDPGAKWPKRQDLNPAATYEQSFGLQLINVLEAIEGGSELLVPGIEGIPSLQLIETCYKQRRLMPMPWLDETECSQAKNLARAH